MQWSMQLTFAWHHQWDLQGPGSKAHRRRRSTRLWHAASPLEASCRQPLELASSVRLTAL